MPPRAAGLLLLATGATPAHHRYGVISLSVQIAVARLAGCARNLAASLAAAPSPPSRTASNCCLLKIARLRAAAAALFTTASAPTAAAQRSTAALQRRYSTNSTCSLQPVDLALYGFDVCQMTSRHIKEWPIEPGSSGTDDSPDGSLALRRVPITFGESDCELTLTGCNPNTCYTIFDLSSRSAAAAATGSVCSRAPLFCDNTRSTRASAVLAEGRPDGCKSTELALALMHTHARARAHLAGHTPSLTLLPAFACTRSLPLDEFSELMAPVESGRPASIFSSFSVEGAKVTWTRAGASFIPTGSSVTIKYSTHSVRSQRTRAPATAHRRVPPVHAQIARAARASVRRQERVTDRLARAVAGLQCASFYSVRGRSYPQNCGGTQMVLTLIEPDIPSQLCDEMAVMPW